MHHGPVSLNLYLDLEALVVQDTLVPSTKLTICF